MRRIGFAIAALVVAVAGIWSVGPERGAEAQGGTPAAGAHPIVGSWEITVSFGGAVQLTNLISYTGDGVVVAANAGQLPGLPPAPGSPSRRATAPGRRRESGRRTPRSRS